MMQIASLSRRAMEIEPAIASQRTSPRSNPDQSLGDILPGLWQSSTGRSSPPSLPRITVASDAQRECCYEVASCAHGLLLDAEQHALVKRKVAELGISMAENVRRVVERDLQPATRDVDLSDIFGIGDSGDIDIAVDRKRVTAEAIAARATRR